MKKVLALAVLLATPFWSCSGEVGGGGGGAICQQAADHLAKCAGKRVSEAPATCDEARARTILETDCGGRSAQSWLDDLCAFLGINCSGLGNGLGNGFMPGAGGGSCAGQCGSTADMGGCYCDAGCVQFGDCCGDYATTCGGGVNPVNPGGGSCGNVTEQGTCNGTVITYCDFGQLVTFNCGAQCQVCPDGYADCSCN